MTSDADLQQDKLDASAYRLYTQLYHLHEQINVHDAREQARHQGYDQGIWQARVQPSS